MLAAGSSKRFGTQKLTHLYHGKPLLQWTIDLLKKLNGEFKKILIISKSLDLGPLETDDFDIVVNEDAEKGLSTSVKLAISTAAKFKSDGLLLLLGDMPRISSDLVKKVLLMNKGRITFPSHDGIKGFPVFLPSKYFTETNVLSGDVGLRKLIALHKGETMSFEGGQNCIFDVDTIKDVVEKVERRL